MQNDNGPMLNAYPDSMGSNMEGLLTVLQKPELKDVFTSFYMLPSIFNSDLDRGFSIIDYGINEAFGSKAQLETLKKQGINLKLDFVLNHLSVLSPQFQDILKNGADSVYKDFFIDWNAFWQGYGEMTQEGYIQPDAAYIQHMFFRKPGLPILMVRFPDGKEVPYWNTFYQEVYYPLIDVQETMQALKVQYGVAKSLTELVNEKLKEGMQISEIDFRVLGEIGTKYEKPMRDFMAAKRRYMGQMDLNIQSDLVWTYYKDVLKQLAGYGAKIVRLDAFAYAPKAPGEKNFLNEPATWEVLERIRQLADEEELTLLPEIHASYAEKIYEVIAQKGYMTYDFFLPGLIIDAIENNNGEKLLDWAKELVTKQIRTVNMLGCHDGIPLLDLKGLLPDERIQELIDTIVERGGYVKNLHGQKNVYYQVNATYFSALGEDESKMLLARALQLFMPGKPQVWYLDLFAGKNDHLAVERAGAGGHKEINRTNLSLEAIEKQLKTHVVQEQLEMIRFRNNCPAFGWDAHFEGEAEGSKLTMRWKKGKYEAVLKADLKTKVFTIECHQDGN